MVHRFTFKLLSDPRHGLHHLATLPPPSCDLRPPPQCIVSPEWQVIQVTMVADGGVTGGKGVRWKNSYASGHDRDPETCKECDIAGPHLRLPRSHTV